jgi:hypothetical protein
LIALKKGKNDPARTLASIGQWLERIDLTDGCYKKGSAVWSGTAQRSGEQEIDSKGVLVDLSVSRLLEIRRAPIETSRLN